MADTATKPPSPALVEKGYASQRSAGFWGYQTDDPETAAELRWPYSLRVFDAMERQDPQIASVMLAPRLLMLSTQWSIDGKGCRDEVTEHVARDLGLPIAGIEDEAPPTRRRDRFSWYEHLNWATRVWRYGHMPFEQTYRYDEDSNRVHLRKLGPRWPRTIGAFNVESDGGLTSIQQYTPTMATTGPEIPISQLVMYCNEREGGAWQGQSVLRPGYKDWMLKDRKLRAQQTAIDRNSLGIPVATAPEGVDDLDPYKTLATQVRNGDYSGAGLPYGADLTLKGVEGMLLDPLPGIRYHDESIAKTVLLHFLNLGQAAGTGSYALGGQFLDFFTLGMQARAQQLADVASMYVVEDLVDLNWGLDEPAPKVTFQKIGSQQEATAAAIALLTQTGVLSADQSLEAFMRSTLGVPAKSGAENPAPEPAMPTPAG